MQEPEGVESYRLDTITRTTRFLAGAAPKAMTRVSLGVVLAVDDAASDPAGELLGAKIAQGTGAIASSVGTIGRFVASKAVSATSSAKAAVLVGVDHIGAKGSAIQNVPALNSAREFVGQAVSEVRRSWNEAGYIAVQVVAEEPVQEDPSVIRDAKDAS